MKDPNQPCILCGKPTTGRYLVNYDNQTGRIMAPDFAGRECGGQPIGSDCRRGVRSDWVIDTEQPRRRAAAVSHGRRNL